MKLNKFKPRQVVWETTLRCNMNCMHCGSSAGNQRIKELTTEESIKMINDFKKLGTIIITLMGGEPFLRKDWFEIASHIKKIGLEMSFISNGFSINEETISKLKQINPNTVGISLDGSCAETHDRIRRVKGSFDRCFHTIDRLKEEGIRTGVVTTVHKNNFKELPEIRNMLNNKKLVWQIQMATPIGRFPRNLMLSKEEFYSVAMFIASTIKNYSPKELSVIGAHNFGYYSKILPNLMLFPWAGCKAGISTIGVTSDGKIKGCMSLPDNFIEGNIREKPIAEIWNDSDFASYNRKFRREDLKGECKKCKHGKSCRGGCLTVSSSLTSKNHCNPYCFNLIEKETITV